MKEEIFRPDLKLKVYFGDKLGMDISSVDDMSAQYKAFGTVKESFRRSGQQVVDFIDDNHATGTCYAIATMVTEENLTTRKQVLICKKFGEWFTNV